MGVMSKHKHNTEMTACLMARMIIRLVSLFLLVLVLVLLCSRSSQAQVQCSSYPLYYCSQTFLDATFHYLYCCPPHCISVIASDSTANSTVHVYGSYPYTGNSSVCLSAIHAGLISEDQGGWVQFTRFGAYHQQVVVDMIDGVNTEKYLVNGSFQGFVANVSLGEIFPFNSSLSSTSNNVTSLPLPLLDYDHSINIYNASTWPLVDPTVDYSYILSGRGTRFFRQLSPYPARAGHITAQSRGGFMPDRNPCGAATFHILIGGKNETHYMNDVWLAEEVLPYHVIQWYRLPAAPFTPRSDMAYKAWIESTSVCRYVIWLIGGQTGHHCQLEQLAICSNEIWALTISKNTSSPTLGLSFTWSAQPSYMPFTPRCGAASINSHGNIDRSAILVGGQLTYNDSTCTQNITTLNEVWYNIDLSTDPWIQADAAPFTPRRDMVINTASDGADNVLLGGITYQSHLVSMSTSKARLTRAEIYSQAYTCWRDASVAASWNHCVWLHGNGSNSSSNPNYIMWTMPVPLVDATPHFAALYTIGMLGGRSSQQALRDWKNTLPPLYVFNNSVTASELLLNVTLINQPYSVGTVDASTGSATLFPYLLDITHSRYSLPLSYVLEEPELNDVSGPFLAGCDGYTTLQRGPSTFYQSTAQTVGLPSFSTPYLYQAASSINTSRGWFDFNLQRHSYATSTDKMAQDYTISGGRSGNHYFNDWLRFLDGTEYGIGLCYPANDPSFYSVLSNGTAEGTEKLFGSIFWTCNDGYHLEPPRQDDRKQTTLTCTQCNMWMDTDMSTISRCVKDKLNCPFPLVDVGDEVCVVPDALITSISVFPNNCQVDPRNPLSLVDCPVGGKLLSITGMYFTQPLLIYVGGMVCDDPQLHDERDQIICHTDAHNVTECSTYGTGIVCSLPPMMGYQLPIHLFTGTDFKPTSLSTVPLMSFAAPIITDIESSACLPSPNSTLQLTDCPYFSAFNITVTGFNFWMKQDDSTPVPGGEPRVALSTFSYVPCQMWDNEGDTDILSCTINPTSSISLTTSLPILIKQASGPVNLLFDQNIQRIASIKLAACPAGSVDIATKNPSVSPSQRCALCPAGTSTNNEENAPTCYLCPPGTYSPLPGSVNCTDCPVNSYASTFGLSSCLSCPANSYQSQTRQSECHTCDLNQYLVLQPNNSIQLSSPATTAAGYAAAPSSMSLSLVASQPVCSPCLSSEDASCYPNGTIVSASSSSYLLVNQHTGTISSVQCLGSRCMSGEVCLSNNPSEAYASAVNISMTSLSIINCCSSHRSPANINPLCGQCESGYSEWSGTCIRCDADHINWGGLCAILIAGIVLLWLLHRLPNDRYTATLSISVYFMQMTLLFFSYQSLPAILGLVNLDFLAEWKGSDHGSDDGSSWCLLPISGIEKMLVKSFMPFYALAFLLCIYLLHTLCHTCTRTTNKASRQTFSVKTLLAIQSALFGLEKTNAADAHGMADDQSATPMSTSPAFASGLSLYSLNSALLPSSSEEVSSSADNASSHTTEPVQQSICSCISVTPYYHTIIRIAVYGYNTVAVMGLSYFHCSSAGEYGQVLYDDPSVSCTSSSYHHYLPVFIALVLLAGTLPLMLAFVLYRYRQQVEKHVSIMQRQPCLLDNQLSSSSQPMEPNEPTDPVVRPHPSVRHLDVLYGAYRPGYTQYAVLILLRRLTLVCLFVFVPQSSSYQCFTAINALCLCLHCRVWPYQRSRDNWMESVSLSALMLQTIVLSIWPLPWIVDSGSTTGIMTVSISLTGAVLIVLFLIALPLCVLLVSGCMDKWPACKQRLHQWRSS